MIYSVIVGVALSRPPRTHEYRKLVVEAPNAREALLVATQMAACTSTMPVSAEVVDVGTETPRSGLAA